MDVIEKAESEWQKIWLHILTGSFPPQGVNETVHDFAESMKILLRNMNYAWHDDCESPSEGEKLTWAREAEGLITWRFWKSLRQEYRAMLPKVEPDSFEEAIFMAKAVEYQLNYVNFQAVISSKNHPSIYKKEYLSTILINHHTMPPISNHRRNFKYGAEKVSKLQTNKFAIYTKMRKFKKESTDTIENSRTELIELQTQLRMDFWRHWRLQDYRPISHTSETTQLNDIINFRKYLEELKFRDFFHLFIERNRAHFESLITKDPSITESHLVTPHLGNFQNYIINPFNGYKNDDRQVRKSEENEPGFRHSRGVTHYNPCIVKVNNIKSPKVDKHILFIDEIENETRNGLNLTPDIGIGPKMTHPCANNDLVEERKHDENVLEIRHIETNGDELLETPKLENKFEHSRRMGDNMTKKRHIVRCKPKFIDMDE
ncbi:hypothetical protein QAD02_003714 [Eretmocerus hayati]|uniref:Uncharacterized protein n=1 Tax=Eretmocerus hayati TaxID=131215 RepID=A0ACC2NMR9_9HYME|nr:hypothetical protein QAD02_003714 [Eretmocerus hayati]